MLRFSAGTRVESLFDFLRQDGKDLVIIVPGSVSEEVMHQHVLGPRSGDFWQIIAAVAVMGLVMELIGKTLSTRSGGEFGSGRSRPKASFRTITPRRATSTTSDGVEPCSTQLFARVRTCSMRSGSIPASTALPS
jgi:hypothetical protein